MSSLSLPTERRARLAALTRLHAAWENLWLASRGANSQWTARNAERSADEVRVRRPALKMLREATRMFGTPDFLAQLGQRLWYHVGPKPAKAKKDPQVDRMVAAMTRALLAQLDENAMEKLRRGVVYELARAAERSESWTRDSLGVGALPPWRDREGFRKQADWTDVEGVFVHEYPELVNEVNGNLTTAVGSHAEQVSHTVVNATNPARPRPIGAVSRDIRQQLPGMSVRRSNMIARTETARSYGRTTHEQYKRNGIERRRTLTAAGSPAATLSPVCDICIDMAAQGWNDTGSPFESRVSTVSADYAPYHPYCRCDTTGDVEGWLPPMEELEPGGFPDYVDDTSQLSFANRNFVPRSSKLFTAAEQEALSGYKAHEYHAINNALRGTGPAVEQSTINALKSAIGKQKLKEGVKLYRGISERVSNVMGWKDLKSGTVIVDKGVLSTSIDKRMVEKWKTGATLEINVPKGTQAVWMESEYVVGQGEILLQPGQKMRVVNKFWRNAAGQVIPYSETAVVSEGFNPVLVVDIV